MTTLTARQRRMRDRDHYLQRFADCPSRRLMDRLSDKWAVLVLVALRDGPVRHAALARRVAGASQKMLTQTLRRLERDGLVARTSVPTVPPQVSYRLTRLGAGLLPVLDLLTDWATEHIGEIDAARAEYDRRAGSGPSDPVPAG